MNQLKYNIVSIAKDIYNSIIGETILTFSVINL